MVARQTLYRSVCGNDPRALIEVRSLQTSQNFGNWVSNTISADNPALYSNVIPIGAVAAADNVMSFIDNTTIPNNNFYPSGATVQINASASKSYTDYFVAIFEIGGAKRYARQDWRKGRAGTINLSTIWNAGGTRNWKFEPFTQYRVQFIISNSTCGNWIDKMDRIFSICQAGGSCSFADENLESEVLIFPNPSSDVISIAGSFEPNEFPIDIQVYNLIGKLVLKSEFTGDNLDITSLASGTHFMRIKSRNSKGIDLVKEFIVKQE